MKHLYANLAVTGIKKNKQIYLPYLINAMGMAAIYYIISYLNISPVIGSLYGARTIQTYMAMGLGVLTFFIFILLIYTHSFLIKKRKKEFGLYNILGMGKKDIDKVLLVETCIVYLLTILGGLFFGILLSKAAELFLLKLIGETATFSFNIPWPCIRAEILLFLGIYALTYIRSLWQVHKTDPLELLHSEAHGEKAPKANWVLALGGTLLLIAAYMIAVNIKDPIAVVNIFFIAVTMVIVATYMIFTAGSVALCKLLQKNKKYYYQPSHFVSVSSMAFRMKRNGAGLASICILSTMILVMTSFSTCVYAGLNDVLEQIVPRDLNMVWGTNDYASLQEEDGAIRPEIDKILSDYHIDDTESGISYHSVTLAAQLQDDTFVPLRYYNSTDLYEIVIVPLDDYNNMSEKDITLQDDEAAVYCAKGNYDLDMISIAGTETKHIKNQIDEFLYQGDAANTILPTLYIVVPDFAKYCNALQPSDESTYTYMTNYGIDLDNSREEIKEAASRIIEILNQRASNSISAETGYMYSVSNADDIKSDYYNLYGGVFFLSIILGIAFIFGDVLIMYYKQITEGYEDQARFAIMQKVGMTKKEIKKSINSQILTVFFLPLLLAGLHLCFVFPFLTKLAYIFNISNTVLLFKTTLCSFLAFALFYVITYKITSHSYYKIVVSMKD